MISPTVYLNIYHLELPKIDLLFSFVSYYVSQTASVAGFKLDSLNVLDFDDKYVIYVNLSILRDMF